MPFSTISLRWKVELGRWARHGLLVDLVAHDVNHALLMKPNLVVLVRLVKFYFERYTRDDRAENPNLLTCEQFEAETRARILARAVDHPRVREVVEGIQRACAKAIAEGAFATQRRELAEAAFAGAVRDAWRAGLTTGDLRALLPRVLPLCGVCDEGKDPSTRCSRCARYATLCAKADRSDEEEGERLKLASRLRMISRDPGWEVVPRSTTSTTEAP